MFLCICPTRYLVLTMVPRNRPHRPVGWVERVCITHIVQIILGKGYRSHISYATTSELDSVLTSPRTRKR